MKRLSVWELPESFDWGPEAVLGYIEGNWDKEAMKGMLFDLACGLYWYCNDWHGGMSCPLYSIMSAHLEYSPDPRQRSPEFSDSDEDVGARFVYCNLVWWNQPSDLEKLANVKTKFSCRSGQDGRD